MTRTKKILCLSVNSVALVLAFASLAFACTSVAGQTHIRSVKHNAPSSCPPASDPNWKCAARGDEITVYATGANRWVPGTSLLIDYYLYLLPYEETQDQMETCMPGAGAEGMGPPGIILTNNAVNASTSGNIADTVATIPATPPTGPTDSLLGPARVCFMGGGWETGSTARNAIKTAGSKALVMNGTLGDSLTIVMI